MKMKITNPKTSRFISALAASLLLASVNSNAVVIIYDDFSGGTGNLGGTTADVGGVWAATTNFKADGITTTAINGGGAGAAIQAFTPATGFIYEMTVGISVPASNGINWVGAGFADKAAVTPTVWNTDTPNPATAYRFSNVNTGGYSWMVAAPVANAGNYLSAFGGLRGTNQATEVGGVDASFTSYNMKITLDTTATNWVSNFFIKDSAAPLYTLLATYTYVGAVTAIDSVGLTTFGASGTATNSATFTNFQLQTIPEPRAALLGGLGLLALLRRRRN